jgi:hypothetical protein
MTGTCANHCRFLQVEISVWDRRCGEDDPMSREIEPYDGAVFCIPALILSRFHMLICSSCHMGSQER